MRDRSYERCYERQYCRSRETARTTRKRFNIMKTGCTFAVPTPGDKLNVATFYRDIMGTIQELINDVRLLASCYDVIQLEVVGENVRRD